MEPDEKSKVLSIMFMKTLNLLISLISWTLRTSIEQADSLQTGNPSSSSNYKIDASKAFWHFDMGSFVWQMALFPTCFLVLYMLHNEAKSCFLKLHLITLLISQDSMYLTFSAGAIWCPRGIQHCFVSKDAL